MEDRTYHSLFYVKKRYRSFQKSTIRSNRIADKNRDMLYIYSNGRCEKGFFRYSEKML